MIIWPLYFSIAALVFALMMINAERYEKEMLEYYEADVLDSLDEEF